MKKRRDYETVAVPDAPTLLSSYNGLDWVGKVEMARRRRLGSPEWLFRLCVVFKGRLYLYLNRTSSSTCPHSACYDLGGQGKSLTMTRSGEHSTLTLSPLGLTLRLPVYASSTATFVRLVSEAVLGLPPGSERTSKMGMACRASWQEPPASVQLHPTNPALYASTPALNAAIPPSPSLAHKAAFAKVKLRRAATEDAGNEGVQSSPDGAPESHQAPHGHTKRLSKPTLRRLTSVDDDTEVPEEPKADLQPQEDWAQFDRSRPVKQQELKDDHNPPKIPTDQAPSKSPAEPSKAELATLFQDAKVWAEGDRSSGWDEGQELVLGAGVKRVGSLGSSGSEDQGFEEGLDGRISTRL